MALTPVYNNDSGSTVRTKINTAFTAIDTATADILTKQPLDADLTTIAALTPSNSDTLQYISGAWANRTAAQAKTTLSLGNVDNTSDANKPVSTATQSALDLKQNYITQLKNETGTITVTSAYISSLIVVNNGGASQINFPDDVTEPNLQIGHSMMVHNRATSSGNVTLQASGGATLLFSGVLNGVLSTKGSALVIKIAIDTWLRIY
jgi:hypothetical protein